MKGLKFKTILGEEVVLLEDVKSSSNTILFEGVSKDDLESIKSKIYNDTKLTSKVNDILKKELKGTEFENRVAEIAKNCIIQLFKQLWLKRASWSNGISNKNK